MTSEKKSLDEGGAKDEASSIENDETDTPALQKENRQAVKNQGKAKPEDYPDRGVSVV